MFLNLVYTWLVEGKDEDELADLEDALTLTVKQVRQQERDERRRLANG